LEKSDILLRFVISIVNISITFSFLPLSLRRSTVHYRIFKVFLKSWATDWNARRCIFSSDLWGNDGVPWWSRKVSRSSWV